MQKIPFNDRWLCNGKPVTLPHDAQISELRSASASDGGHGYFPGGIPMKKPSLYPTNGQAGRF